MVSVIAQAEAPRAHHSPGSHLFPKFGATLLQLLPNPHSRPGPEPAHPHSSRQIIRPATPLSWGARQAAASIQPPPNSGWDPPAGGMWCWATPSEGAGAPTRDSVAAVGAKQLFGFNLVGSSGLVWEHTEIVLGNVLLSPKHPKTGSWPPGATAGTQSDGDTGDMWRPGARGMTPLERMTGSWGEHGETLLLSTAVAESRTSSGRERPRARASRVERGQNKPRLVPCGQPPSQDILAPCDGGSGPEQTPQHSPTVSTWLQCHHLALPPGRRVRTHGRGHGSDRTVVVSVLALPPAAPRAAPQHNGPLCEAGPPR